MDLFYPKNVSKKGVFFTPVFMSWCPSLVSYPGVPVKNQWFRHEKTPYKSRRYFENGGRLRIRSNFQNKYLKNKTEFRLF